MSEHVILSADTHRELRIRTDRGVALGDGVMACITVPAEFRNVQNEYLILFRLNQERDSFTALAMFGFENGENLYLKDGRWDARYLPLAMEIQPFLIGRTADPSDDKQVHLDAASPRIAQGEGVRVFDEDGQPSPYLEQILDKLGALDAGYQASDAFFAALRRYELIEPLTLEVTLDDGSTNRLVGFHAINEERLRALGSGELGELQAEGHLMPIYMALASLSNIRALVERKNLAVGHG
jgi:hypothetical protein